MKVNYILLITSFILSLTSCVSDEDLFLNNDSQSLSDVNELESIKMKYPLKSFITVVNLDASDITNVNYYLSDMQNSFGEWYLPLFAKLKSDPIAEIMRGSTGIGSSAPAAYYATQNILVFLTDAEIRYNNVCEELIHAGQQRIYPGGITQYGKAEGIPNIEFEAKLAQDLVNCINELPFNLGEGVGNSEEYAQWVIELCDEGDYNYGFPTLDKVLNTEYHRMGYFQMVESFRKKYEAYDYPVDLELKPLYINYISNNISRI